MLRWGAVAQVACSALPDATCHHAQLHMHGHNSYIHLLICLKPPDVRMPIHQVKHPEQFTFAG